MKTAVQRWGNSLALRIPSAYAMETHISEGSEVELTLKGGSLVVKPAPRKRYTLDQLLKRVSPKNLHAAVDAGGGIGKEIW